jgi:uncharacterized protein (DUF433 family)
MVALDTLISRPPPIRLVDGEVWRVGNTRVTLDSVLYAFNNGSCAEEILLKFPSLELVDIYALIAYFLWHRDEIDAYLIERQRVAAEISVRLRSQFPSEGIRERLLARRGKTT